MHVTHLSLTNFRNYSRLELTLPPGPTLFYGANAQGKTNLLEAIYYLATTRSPHADQDQQLVNWGVLESEEPIIVGRLAAQVEAKDGPIHIEMRLIREKQQGQVTFRRQALVNRRKVRLMDVLGNLRVVLFLPQDVQIISGSPAKRRRYLDITLCQVDRHYCQTLSAYNKVLEQRNALLRRIAERAARKDLLPVYDEQIVHLGSQLFNRRAHFLEEIARRAQRIHYERLTDGQETLRLKYLPRLIDSNHYRGDDEGIRPVIEEGEWLADARSHQEIEARLAQTLQEIQGQEIASGSTRVGPHRDDWRFWVSGRNLSSFGSRGQQRTALLALKLAEIEWMATETGETPLLLLDEVVAELDERRRALLLETVMEASQALVTATDTGMLTAAFMDRASTMHIVAGSVSHDRKETIEP